MVFSFFGFAFARQLLREFKKLVTASSLRCSMFLVRYSVFAALSRVPAQKALFPGIQVQYIFVFKWVRKPATAILIDCGGRPKQGRMISLPWHFIRNVCGARSGSHA